MKISRTRTYTLKIQEYEMYGFSVIMEATHADMGLSDEEVSGLTRKEHAALYKRMKDYVEDKLLDLLTPEVEEAQRLSSFRNSFIHDA